MQLQLFEPQTKYPDGFLDLLDLPETMLGISTSGGKDSVAMIGYLARQQYGCKSV